MLMSLYKCSKKESNLQLPDYKSGVLPIELLEQKRITRIELVTNSLEGYHSTIELYPQKTKRVGFEPTVQFNLHIEVAARPNKPDSGISS